MLVNHEFDFGPDVLQERLAESETVWLAGNVSVAGVASRHHGDDGGGEDGYRIGFLGLVTTETPVISSPGPDVASRPLLRRVRRLPKF